MPRRHLRATMVAGLSLAAALAAGCGDDDIPGDEQRFTATARVDGEIALSGQAHVVVVNPVGGVTVLGEAVGPRVRWSVDKSVTGPSAPAAHDHLVDIGLISATTPESVLVDVTTPVDMSTFSYSGLVTLGVPAAMECAITAVAGTTQVGFLVGDLSVVGTGVVVVTAHTGSCNVVTGAGDVAIEVALPDAGSCIASTGAGNITLRVPTATSAQVTCSTGAGSITVIGLTLVDSDAAPHALSGTLGAGAGTIHLSTGAGNVELRGI